MKKFVVLILAVAMVLSISAVAFADVYNVAYLVNGNLGDKSFFDSAQAGLTKLEEEGRIELTTIEMGGTDEDQPTWLSTLYDVSASEDYDVIICGDGSADIFAQQVDVQLAYKLGIPSVNSVISLEAGAGAITARRKLEDVIETVELPLPCLVAVTPDIALPRIPGMGDILKAGKKPMEVSGAANAYANVTETISVKAPEQVDRKLDVKDAAEDGAIEAFAAAIKAAL